MLFSRGRMARMPLAPGSRLGEYEIVALLGSAGMADPGLLQRLKQEARTVAALNHPSLLAIYDIGELNGAPFLVMELLEGETLRAKLAQGKLPLRRTLAIARAIAQGLAAAHEHGVIHRDLKPENIFLLGDGRAKILDFGLAKADFGLGKAAPGAGASAEAQTLALAPSAATMPGMVLGTAGYMAPERCAAKPRPPAPISLPSAPSCMKCSRASAPSRRPAAWRCSPPSCATSRPKSRSPAPRCRPGSTASSAAASRRIQSSASRPPPTSISRCPPSKTPRALPPRAPCRPSPARPRRARPAEAPGSRSPSRR